jgi:hypothetical protein
VKRSSGFEGWLFCQMAQSLATSSGLPPPVMLPRGWFVFFGVHVSMDVYIRLITFALRVGGVRGLRRCPPLDLGISPPKVSNQVLTCT